MQGRGLKPAKPADRSAALHHVAPHAGAWIETTCFAQVHAPLQDVETLRGKWLRGVQAVAPHAGAWIETLSSADWISVQRNRSPLMQGRGLKPSAASGH